MQEYILLILLPFLTLGSSSYFKHKPRDIDCGLPPQCKLTLYSSGVTALHNHSEFFTVFCKSETINSLEKNNLSISFNPMKCLLSKQSRNVLFWRLTLIEIIKSIEHSEMLPLMNSFGKKFSLVWFDMKGFSVDQNNQPSKTIINYDNFEFIKFERAAMNFYIERETKHKLVRSCRDLHEFNITQPATIFQTNSFKFFRIEFLASKYQRRQICSRLLRNAKIYHFVVGDMFDTFFKREMIQFEDDHQTSEINSSVIQVSFKSFSNLKFDTSILNKSIFRKMSFLVLRGEVASIQTDLFGFFPHLEEILIDSPRAVFHRQGLAWLTYLNRHVKVNLSDRVELTNEIVRRIDISVEIDAYERLIKHTFPDEDFCLFRDFPYEQLVLLGKFRQRDDPTLTCTYSWLLKHAHKLDNLLKPAFKSLLRREIERIKSGNQSCDWTRMLAKCRKSQKLSPLTINYFYLGHFSNFIIWILVFFDICVSIFGCLTNLLTTITISHKKNKKLRAEQKHFHYMRVNAITNTAIFVSRLLGLAFVCDLTNRIFCSPLHPSTFAQLYQIIVIDFLGGVFIYMSSVSFVAFTLSRIALIGKEHGAWITWTSTTSIAKFLSISIPVCVLFNVIEIFKHRLNLDDPDNDYPMLFKQAPSYRLKPALTKVYLSFELVNSLGFSLVLVLAQMSVDVSLIVKLKRTLDIKMNQTDAKKTRSEKAVRRAVLMMIVNITLNILAKSAFFLLAIYDFFPTDFRGALFLNNPNNVFLVLEDGQLESLLRKLFDTFMLGTFASNFFFFLKFDKRFRVSFYKTFPMVFDQEKSNNRIQSSTNDAQLET